MLFPPLTLQRETRAELVDLVWVMWNNFLIQSRFVCKQIVKLFVLGIVLSSPRTCDLIVHVRIGRSSNLLRYVEALNNRFSYEQELAKALSERKWKLHDLMQFASSTKLKHVALNARSLHEMFHEFARSVAYLSLFQSLTSLTNELRELIKQIFIRQHFHAN